MYTWDVPGSVLGTSLDSEVTPEVYLGFWDPHLGGFYGGLWGLYPGTNHGSLELHSGGLERSIVGSWWYCGSDTGVPRGIPEGLWSHAFEYLWKALGLTPKSAYGGLWGSRFGVFLGHKFWEHL